MVARRYENVFTKYVVWPAREALRLLTSDLATGQQFTSTDPKRKE